MLAADPAVDPPTPPLKVLAVCTGNVCRSPMVERLLQAGLDNQLPREFIVTSAGTGALVGHPIDPRVAEFIHELGGSTADFSARQVTPEILAHQDLILTLTREHRSRIVEMSPATLKKAFTFREFARLLPTIELNGNLGPAAFWRMAIPRALRERSGDILSHHDDVIDPYRRANDVYDRMRAEIAPAVDSILQVTRNLI